MTAKPVILFDTELADKVKTDEDCWGVRQSDIRENVVPPALSEMWKDVLPGKLQELIEDAPEMA